MPARMTDVEKADQCEECEEKEGDRFRQNEALLYESQGFKSNPAAVMATTQSGASKPTRMQTPARMLVAPDNKAWKMTTATTLPKIVRIGRMKNTPYVKDRSLGINDEMADER